MAVFTLLCLSRVLVQNQIKRPNRKGNLSVFLLKAEEDLYHVLCLGNKCKLMFYNYSGSKVQRNFTEISSMSFIQETNMVQ